MVRPSSKLSFSVLLAVLTLVLQGFIGFETRALASDDKACNGWRVHLVSVEKKSTEAGWINISGIVAWENVNNQDSLPPSMIDPLQQKGATMIKPLESNQNEVDEFYKIWNSLKVTTKEGWSYEVQIALGDEYVPKGLSYEGQSYDNDQGPDIPTVPSLAARVSEASTGLEIATPCGDLKIDEPVGKLSPNGVSYSALSEEIPVHGGAISFVSQKQSDKGFKIRFENRDKGYGNELLLRYLYLVPDGRLFVSERWFFPILSAGPGQTVEVETPLGGEGSGTPVLLVVQEYYKDQQATTHQIWIRGVTFAVSYGDSN